MTTTATHLQADLRAIGWNDPACQPHWDGIRDQVREWLSPRGVVTDHDTYLPRPCVIRVANGQTAADLGLRREVLTIAPRRDLRGLRHGAGLDVEVIPSVIEADGETFVQCEFLEA